MPGRCIAQHAGGGRDGAYLRVNLSNGSRGSRRTRLVHRLVALAFLGKPPTRSAHVDHVDGNRQNNRPANLRYMSASDNARRGSNYRWHGSNPEAFNGPAL